MKGGNSELVKAESLSAAAYSWRMLIFGAALLQSFVSTVCSAIWRIIWLMGSARPRKQNNYILIH